MTKLKILLAVLSAVLLPRALSAATTVNPAAGVPIPFRWFLLTDSAPSPTDRPQADKKPADHGHDDHGPAAHGPGDHGPSDHGSADRHAADHGSPDHGPGARSPGARSPGDHGSADSKSAASGDESSHGGRHGRGFGGWDGQRGRSDQADSEEQSNGPRSRGFTGRPGANPSESGSGDPGARWRGTWGGGPNAGNPMNRSGVAGPMNRDGGRDGEPSRFASPTNPRTMGPRSMPGTMTIRLQPSTQANPGPMPGMSLGGPGMMGPYGQTDPAAMQRMMQMRGQMQRQMQSGDDDLDHLVDEMNGSVGEHKVDAMAAIINRLMQERKSMRRGLASMGPGMGGPETARPDTSRARIARFEASAEVASDEDDNEDDSDTSMDVQTDPSSMWRQMLQRRIEERRASAEGNSPQSRNEAYGSRTPQKVRAGGPGPSSQSDEEDDDDN